MSASCRNTGCKMFTPLFESFIKYVLKNCEKYMEKNKYITFFLNTVYTRTYIHTQKHHISTKTWTC